MITFDASDFDNWAQQTEAESRLPELIRRLILATCPMPSLIDMPSGSSIYLPGWDGLLNVKVGNTWVPNSASGWEMSRRKAIAQKAHSDYQKRTAKPLGQNPAKATFVFVTPRKWKEKEAWVRRHLALGQWANVRAWDADDLVAWIGEAPGVAHWFARLIGKLPDEGWVSLDEWWQHWSRMTNPSISAELVLAGRENEIGGLQDWIQGVPDRYYVQARTRDEAIAFVASCATRHDGPWNALLLSRAIVVHTPDAWHSLEHHHIPLVLIRNFSDTVASHVTVHNCHHVLTPLDEREEPFGAGSRLSPLGRDETPQALMAMGLSEARAHSLITRSARRLSLMRRFLLDESGSPAPEWLPVVDETVVPLILIGQWNTNQESDRDIIAEVVGKPYEDIENRLMSLALVPDSPLEKIGEQWRFVSHEDAWHFLAPRLSASTVQRFKQVALRVLGENSPALEIPVDERYLASVYGKTTSHSDTLCEGISRSLAIMGTLGERAQFAGDVANLPADIVRTALGVDAGWRVWATLERNLIFLAEAAPDTFLDAVDASLNSSTNLFEDLFAQEGDILFTSTPHTGVLWALESLGWSADHFARVAKILARLAELDPGGQVANRPINSLSDMFLPWVRFSEAPNDDRLATLSMLLNSIPEIGWQVLLRARAKIVVNLRRPPMWQPLAQDGVPSVTEQDCSTYVNEMDHLLVENLQDDISRWGEVLENIARFEPEVRPSIINKLTEQLDILKQNHERDILWAKVRGVLYHHRRYPNAAWALGPEDLQSLHIIYQGLTPSDPVIAYAWLFGNLPFDAFPDVPDPIPVDPDSQPVDMDADLQHVRRKQESAISTAYSQGGIDVVLRIADAARSPYQVGRVAASIIDGDSITGAALKHLASTNQSLRVFAHGVLQEFFDKSGWTYLEGIISTLKANGVDVEALADTYSVAPINTDTWDRLQSEEKEVSDAYWKKVHPFRIPTDDEMSPSIAVKHFLDVHRPVAALNLVMHASVPSSSIISVLEQLPRDPANRTPEFAELGEDGFRIARLFERLDADDQVLDAVVANLEIPYIDILHFDRKKLALHQQVLQSPSLFADLIAWVFKRSDDQPDDVIDDENRQARAHRAFAILQDLQGIPGLMENGAVEYETLSAWVKEARRLCRDRGRDDIGDQYIGQILANAPPDDDGAWPCEPVRNLLEEIGTQYLGVGFVIGKRSRRGMTSRSLFDGGEQERTLADSYQTDAARIRARWPFTSRLLRDLAGDYQAEGRMHDREADWHDR